MLHDPDNEPDLMATCNPCLSKRREKRKNHSSQIENRLVGVENKISGVEQKTDALAREVGEIKVELNSPRQACAAIRVANDSSSSSTHQLQERLQCRITLKLASGKEKIVTAKIDTMSDVDAVSNPLYEELKEAGAMVIENPAPTIVDVAGGSSLAPRYCICADATVFSNDVPGLPCARKSFQIHALVMDVPKADLLLGLKTSQDAGLLRALVLNTPAPNFVGLLDDMTASSDEWHHIMKDTEFQRLNVRLNVCACCNVRR